MPTKRIRKRSLGFIESFQLKQNDAQQGRAPVRLWVNAMKLTSRLQRIGNEAIVQR